ncbi:sulfite exporter TauE/SafE family protein [Candidatus Woesebacteria bacterium]|nr:sulfite exporter TauE/SafE family protein [Candidatus Woesebacteria bacterium]
MFKKTLFLVTLSFMLISPISAQTTESTGAMMVPDKMMPPIIDPSDSMLIPIFGEDHAYTVTLRGNGEVIIDMRVALSNFEENPKSEVILKYSGSIVPTDVAVFQIVKEKQCVSYDNRQVMYDSGKSMDVNTNCLEYQEPNYYDYWGMNQKYFKAGVEVKDNQIYITLPKPIAPEKSGSYILFMRSRGVTEKVFGGAFSYRFETMTTDSSIRNLQIGILSDSEMKFKGADAQVYYGAVTNSSIMMDMAAKRSAFQSTDFDNYVSQIGQGQIYKNSSNLSPGDTYVVDGMYAKSIVSLYLKEALSILGLIFLTFIIILGIVFGISKFRSKTPTSQKPVSHMKAMIVVLTTGFISGLCIGGYTLILVAVSRFLENWYGFTNMFSMLIIAIFSCGVYALFIFGPTVVAWFKRGWKWGALMFGITMLWIVMFLVIIGGYYLTTGFFSKSSTSEKYDSQYVSPPVPMMRGEEIPPPIMDEIAPIEVVK